MSLTREEIDQLSDEEIRQRYDQHTQNVVTGLSFWRDELWLRQQQRGQQQALELTREANEQTATIRRLTWAILGLTVAVAVLTAVNLLAVLA